MKTKKLTVERMRELFSYDEATGLFTRKVKVSIRGPVGSIAGSVNDQGYIIIVADYEKHSAHRLAWLYMTGEWPVNEVDHVNGNRSDNRFVNLRDVEPTVNRQNQRKAMSNSKTGVLGVSWNSKDKKYTSRLKVDGRYLSLGYHDSVDSARSAYLSAKRKLHAGCTI